MAGLPSSCGGVYPVGGAVSVTPAPSQSGAGSEPYLLALALLRGRVGEVVPPLLLRVWGQPSQPPALVLLGLCSQVSSSGPLIAGTSLVQNPKAHCQGGPL